MLSLILATTLSISDYATMPVPSSPRMSPDGKRVAYVVTKADMDESSYDANLWIADADGSGVTQLTRGDADDIDPSWSPDGKRIGFVSDRDNGRNAVWIIDPDHGEPMQLTHDKGSVSNFVWSPDSKSIAYIVSDPPSPEEKRRRTAREDVHVVGEHERQWHLYIVDLDGGRVRRMTRGSFSVDHPSWSPDGKRIVLSRMSADDAGDWYRTDLYTISTEVECDANSCPGMTPLVVRPGTDAYGRYSPDGKWIAFFTTGGVFDWLRETEIDVVPATGGKPQVISRDYDRSADDFTWTRDSRSLYLNGPWNTTSQIFRVNADGSAFARISNVSGVITDAAFDPQQRRVAFVEQTLTDPPEVYVSDVATFAPRQITHINDAYRNRTLAGTQVVRWKNPKDGLEIEGLLTLPIGYEPGQKYPLLTFVHGGPASRFDQAFLGYLGYLYAPETLAANGFAVLRPNPRGTGGYGQKFREANRNDWGGMDWIDVNAGIDKLIADGIADPDRLGLMGWSYGGFLAAWAVGHSNRMRAISIGAPVVDLLSFYGTTDIRDFIPSYFSIHDVNLLRERSPLWNLKRTSAAVLIQQGEADERVPMSQGSMLYRVLDSLGTNVTMVTYPRARHVPREPKQRIDVATRNLELFRRYVLNDEPPAQLSSSGQ